MSTDLHLPEVVLHILQAARMMMGVGIASLLVAAAVLLVFGAVETYRHVALLLTPADPELTNREAFLTSIKLIDLVLLATILQAVAVGLYSLFIDSAVPVPRWLKATDVDDLKHRVGGLVVIMLGVLFLEQVIHGSGERDLLPLGIAIAAVMAALSYFIRARPHRG
jgi:uncharacterized membrane protein YqhA